jgi:hypothetical protein
VARVSKSLETPALKESTEAPIVTSKEGVEVNTRKTNCKYMLMSRQKKEG